MADKLKKIYAPLPARAMADDELTAQDFRVLMAVASHDRFNRNGRGCCASHPELARKAKCHPKSLSRSLKALAERGYIEGLPSPKGKIHRAYRVIYNDADRAIMARPIGTNPVTYQDAKEGVIGNNHDTENPPIGNNGVFKPEQNQCFPVPYKRCSETRKRFSETALLRNEETESPLQYSDGQFLGKVQTRLRAMSGKDLTSVEVQELQQKRDRCTELEDLHGIEQIGGWAQRLGTDIDILLDESGDEDDEPFFAEDHAVNGCRFTTTRINGDGEFIGEPRRFTAVIGGRS